MSQEQTTEQDKAAAPATPSTPEKTKKDLWDKIDILSKPIFASLTAGVIALLGYYGQSTLTAISAQEQNARLYTELLSRREEAESALRKDMFKEIMSGFFADVDARDVRNSLSKKILKLEMLALNFGDSLSLGPLFKEMSNDIERVLAANKETVIDWQNVASVYQKRLRGLAKRVASAQLSTIYPRGTDIKLTEIPTELVEIPDDNHQSQEWSFTLNDMSKMGSKEDIDAHVVELDGVKRIFEIRFRNADLKNQSVQVKLNIFEFFTKQAPDAQGVMQSYEDLEKVADMEFTLDFFNFPLIDNTRLSHNQRFALVLEQFDINTIKVTGVVFPGLYASERDKPFLNEAIQELKDQQYPTHENGGQATALPVQ